jgi:DNA primase
MARVASLPAGTDPDDFVRQKGPEALRGALRSARGMLEYLIDQALEEGFSAHNPETQGHKIQQVLDLIRAEPDPTVRALAHSHADRIAARLGIADARSMSALSRAVRQAGQAPETSNAVSKSPQRARSSIARDAIEASVLAALTEYPPLMSDAAVQALLKHVSGPLALAVAALSHNPLDPSELLPHVPDELRHVVAEHLAAPQLPDEATARRVLLDNLGKLAQGERKLIKAELEVELRKARSSGDQAREDELLAALLDLARQSQRA